MNKSTPSEVEALMAKARELYPNSLLEINYYGSNDSPDGDDLHVTTFGTHGVVSKEYIHEANEQLMDLARELMWLGGADYDNEGGGGTIEIDTKTLTIKRQEYNNHYSKQYEPEENWQVW